MTSFDQKCNLKRILIDVGTRVDHSNLSVALPNNLDIKKSSIKSFMGNFLDRKKISKKPTSRKNAFSVPMRIKGVSVDSV